MYKITEVDMNGRRTLVAQVATFHAAKEHITNLGCEFLEDDVDYPGCADAFLSDGRVMAIEPEGFTLL